MEEEEPTHRHRHDDLPLEDDRAVSMVETWAGATIRIWTWTIDPRERVERSVEARAMVRRYAREIDGILPVDPRTTVVNTTVEVIAEVEDDQWNDHGRKHEDPDRRPGRDPRQ